MADSILKFLEDKVSDIGNWFVKEGATAWNKVGEAISTAGEQMAPLKENQFYNPNPAAGKAVTDFAKTVVRAPFRAAQSVAQDYINPQGGTEFVPQSRFEKLIFGEEPVQSLSKQYREAYQTLKSSGFGKASGPVAGVAVFGGALLDLTPVGGSEKNLEKALLKETTIEGAAKVLSKIGVAEDLIKTYAPKFAEATKPEEIKAGLTSLKKIVENTNLETKIAENVNHYFQVGGESIGKETPNAGLVNLEKILNTPEGKTIADARTQDLIKNSEIPLNANGKIDVYRVGKPGKVNNLTSVTYGEEAAQAFKAGQKAENVPVYKFQVDPKDVSLSIGGPEKELLLKKSVVETGINGAKDLSKERGFTTSVKEVYPANKFVAGQYIPRSTDELATKAQNLVRDDIQAAERVALNGSDDKAVAMASELIKYYGDQAAIAADTATKEAFEQKAADIANTIAPKLTEAGRTVQAASILGRLTPEGVIRFAAGEIQKYNEMIDLSKGKSLSFLKKVPELTGEQAGKLIQQAKDIEATTEAGQKAVKTKKLQDELSNLIPSPLWKKVVSIWKAGLLTGIKTSGLNILANTSHEVLETAKDLPAAAIDSVASLFTKKRTLTLNLKGEAGGIKEGFEKGWEFFKTGVDGRDGANALKYDYKKVNFGQSPIAKTLQKYEETIFRAMGAEDQPFYYGAKARSLFDQAAAQAKNLGLAGEDAKKFVNNLVQNPTEDMIKYAGIDAETAVFSNKTTLGELGSAVQQKGGIVGNIVVPFSRTPSAVMMQVLNYSPIGIIKTIAENVGKGRFDQRLFSQGLARGITGTAIMYLGSKLFDNDLITLNYPTDERTQEQWKAEGRTPNSIKVGDKWREAQALGPAGFSLIIGAHIKQGLDKTGSVTGAIAQGTFGGLKSFSEQTFLQGAKMIMDTINDPGRYGEAYFGNLLGSAVPTIVNDVGRAKDPYERRSRSVLERVESRIPFLRESLQPQIDVFGQENKKGGNFIETMIDPTRPSAIQNSPVIDEIKRLNTKGFKVSPTLLGDKDGYSSLTPEENTILLQRAGQLTESKIANVISSPAYTTLSDDQKAKVIEDFTQKSKDVARAEMVIEKTQGLSGDGLVKALAEYKKSGLLTSDVYSWYKKLR